MNRCLHVLSPLALALAALPAFAMPEQAQAFNVKPRFIGEILVQNHCYRADEMAIMIDIAKEFGYKIRAFHHASEAYKIADLLAKNDICAATWAGSGHGSGPRPSEARPSGARRPRLRASSPARHGSRRR